MSHILLYANCLIEFPYISALSFPITFSSTLLSLGCFHSKAIEIIFWRGLYCNISTARLLTLLTLLCLQDSYL